MLDILFLKEQSAHMSHRVIEMFNINFESESDFKFQIFLNSQMKHLIFPSSALLTYSRIGN